MALVGLAHASSHFSHLLLPIMFPFFMQEWGLTFTQLGLLTTVYFVVSGLGQAAIGFGVDRVGAWPVLMASLLLLALASGVASVANGYAMLLLVAVLAGLGNCSFHPVDFSILNQRVSSARLGYAFSVHGLTGSLGWAAAPLILGSVAAVWGWRFAYGLAATLYLVIALLLLWQRAHLHTVAARSLAAGVDAARASTSISAPAQGLRHRAVFSQPVVWWCFGFFLLSTLTLAVVQNFAVPLLQALHGASATAATHTLTAYMLCSALGILLGGWLAARWARRSDQLVAICMSVGAACMALSVLGSPGSTWPLVVLALTGLAVGIAGPSRDLMIKNATPAGATGRVYGLVYSGLDVGLALSPAIFGVWMDRGWYAATLLGAALTLLLSVAVALMVGAQTRQRVQV